MKDTPAPRPTESHRKTVIGEEDLLNSVLVTVHQPLTTEIVEADFVKARHVKVLFR